MPQDQTRLKIFVWDQMQLAQEICHNYLRDQIFHFSMESGPGLGLFYNPRRLKKVYLIQDPAFKGCLGELWEVSQEVFNRVEGYHQCHDGKRTSIVLPGSSLIYTWVTPLTRLRGYRLRQIQDFRHPSRPGGLLQDTGDRESTPSGGSPPLTP